MEPGAVPHLQPSAAEWWGWVGFHASGQDIQLPFLAVRPLAIELEEFLSRK